MTQVSIVMPTMNEEKSITKVVNDIKKYAPLDSEILIVDSSKDKTVEIAKEMGVKVIQQQPCGPGKALIEAIVRASGDIVITTDCDDTYPMEDIPKFIELMNQGYDIISGSRMHKGNRAMPLTNKFGNWFFAVMTRILYGIKTTDVTTGMRAYKRAVAQSMKWETNYAFPVEIVIRAVRNGFKFKEVKIGYHERIGTPTLNKWRSGKAYIYTILKYKFNLKLKNKVL